MYFEFESMSSPMSSSTNELSMSSASVPMSGLNRRHRRLSSSTQSLREVIDSENVIENITPYYCDLYLITRKKLSQNTVRQTQDLRREVLLTSVHRNITTKSSTSPSSHAMAVNDMMMTSDNTSVATNRSDKPLPQHMTNGCEQHFKYDIPLSSTTSTCTTTMANSNGCPRMMTTTSVKTNPSVIKKRNLTTNPHPNSDYCEEWMKTIKRLKVVHGFEDVSMDSDFDGYCDIDLNDLTNNFHSLKTPFT